MQQNCKIKWNFVIMRLQKCRLKAGNNCTWRKLLWKQIKLLRRRRRVLRGIVEEKARSDNGRFYCYETAENWMCFIFL